MFIRARTSIGSPTLVSTFGRRTTLKSTRRENVAASDHLDVLPPSRPARSVPRSAALVARARSCARSGHIIGSRVSRPSGKMPDGLTMRRALSRLRRATLRRVGRAPLDLDEPSLRATVTEHGGTEHARGRQQAQRSAHASARQRQQHTVGVAGVIGDHDDRARRQGAAAASPPALALDLQPAEEGGRRTDHTPPTTAYNIAPVRPGLRHIGR